MNLLEVKIGEKSPDVINAIIEIPKKSHNKYEIDKESGLFKLDRVLYSPLHYPVDYGFIPETHCEDGDNLDVLILGSDPLFPGCLVSVRPVGLLKMVDSGEEDNKILGVQVDNPRFDSIKDIKDITSSNEHLLKEITHFFEVYKKLQRKEVKIVGWENSSEAKKEIIKSHERYTHNN